MSPLVTPPHGLRALSHMPSRSAGEGGNAAYRAPDSMDATVFQRSGSEPSSATTASCALRITLVSTVK